MDRDLAAGSRHDLELRVVDVERVTEGASVANRPLLNCVELDRFVHGVHRVTRVVEGEGVTRTGVGDGDRTILTASSAIQKVLFASFFGSSLIVAAVEAITLIRNTLKVLLLSALLNAPSWSVSPPGNPNV